jgi:hypothetical protein
MAGVWGWLGAVWPADGHSYPVPAHLGAPGVDLLGQRAQCRAAGDR